MSYVAHGVLNAVFVFRVISVEYSRLPNGLLFSKIASERNVPGRRDDVNRLTKARQIYRYAAWKMCISAYYGNRNMTNIVITKVQNRLQSAQGAEHYRVSFESTVIRTVSYTGVFQ